MNGSIVCGVDGSADSQAALRVAAQLANRLGTRLVLAYVVDYPEVRYAAVGLMGAGGAMGAGGFVPRPIESSTADEIEKASVRLLEQVADDAGLTEAERRVVVGFPAERLADLADEEEAELIVVGSRGRGAFKSAFLGSVSSSLVGVARCPVLVVPPGAADFVARLERQSEATSGGWNHGSHPQAAA
jgi:nucleotide-binding universal stress UspA family protein